MPETGPWTCVVITLMTIGIESNTYLVKHLKEALIDLADKMIEIYKK